MAFMAVYGRVRSFIAVYMCLCLVIAVYYLFMAVDCHLWPFPASLPSGDRKRPKTIINRDKQHKKPFIIAYGCFRLYSIVFVRFRPPPHRRAGNGSKTHTTTKKLPIGGPKTAENNWNLQNTIETNRNVDIPLPCSLWRKENGWDLLHAEAKLKPKCHLEARLLS